MQNKGFQKYRYNFTKLGLLILLILLIPSVIAEESFIFKQGENATLRIPIFENDISKCSTCSCTLSIDYQGENLEDDTSTSIDGHYALFNLTGDTHTLYNGLYEVDIHCSNGADSGAGTFEYLVTPNGEKPETSKAILYIGVFLVLMLFFILSLFGIVKVENMWGRFAFFWVAYLLLLAVSFTAWDFGVDFLTGSSFLTGMLRIIFFVFLIALFPVVLSSIAWIVYIHTVTKEMNDLMERGLSPEEAWGRRGGKRW